MGYDKDDSENKRKKQKVKPKSAKEKLERKKLLREKAKKRLRRRKLISALITLFIIIIIVPIFVLGSFIKSLDKGDLMEGVAPKSNESLNILLLGMDIGDVEQVENTDIKNTDTIMVLNYNPNTKKVNLVSVPRDTLIEVDAYDGNGILREYWKINSAYILGGEEEVITHVENLLDININYIAEVDYEAFRNFIDAIGGIKMYIEEDMFYDDDTQDLHINFTGGETVLLDGKGAEEFFRWRGNNDKTGLSDGDLGRIRNQHKLIQGVIKKCLSPTILFKMPKILDVVKEDIAINMPAKKIVYYGFEFLFNEGISMSTLEGYPEEWYGDDFLVVDKDSNREIINSLKTGESLEDDSSRVNYNILVLNGSGINGLAGSVKEDMEYVGYNKIEVGNSGDQDESIIITENKELRKQLKSDVGITKFEKNKNDDYADYDAVIIIGKDFNIN